jgi:hypothetical protein
MSEEFFTIDEFIDDTSTVLPEVLQSSIDGSENSGDPNPENIPLSFTGDTKSPKYSIPIVLLQKMTQVSLSLSLSLSLS